MKFLIAGLGSIGRRHLKNLLALGERDIILYRTHQSTLPDRDLSGLLVETDLKKALAHRPDAVIISNPTAMHMQVAIPCAEAGCALFIEKPIAYHLDELTQFEQIIDRHENKVFSAFQFRFNPGLRQISEFIHSNVFGRPLSFDCYWGEYLPGWHPWEDYRESYAAKKEMGGGVVLTLSHPLDYLLWFFGEVSEIFSITEKISDLDLEVDDFSHSLIQFKSGLIGSLHLNYYRQPKRHDIEITCTDGVIYWDYASSDVKFIKPDGKTEIYPAPSGFERNDMYVMEMKHFIDVVKGIELPVCGYEEGKKALELAWGILHSGRYKQRVIFNDKERKLK